MEIIYDSSYHCGTCLKGNPEKVELKRKIRNCQAYVEKYSAPIRYNSFVIKFATCPGNYFSRYVQELFHVNEFYNKGILPYGRTIYGLANKFVEAMLLIDNMNSKLKAEAQKNG